VIRRFALMLAVAAALLVPDVVMAQAASPTETQLQMERRQRRVIVRPSPSPETVERDVQAAAAEAEQRQRQEETVRELRRPLPRRPDLDYDIKSGIQSQRLNDALRKR
jgi:hypothetical protein